MTTETVCPHCGGTGKAPTSQFYPGDKVLWRTDYCWGEVRAEVLKPSAPGKRVKIRTDPHPMRNAGRPWITYVSLNRLRAVP